MATHAELKKAVDKVAAIDVEGFDNDWVLHACKRKQALLNIKLIKPYTDKYAIIVRYLVTGDKSIRKAVANAASAAVYAAVYTSNDDAAAAAYVATAVYIIAAEDDIYSNPIYAAVATANYNADARDKAITTLNEMVDNYLSLLSD